MNLSEHNERFEFCRKFREYESKIIKMAGHLADYYIDRALESEDFSHVSGFLIDYFSGPAGKPLDAYELLQQYKEFGLNEKIEDIDFNIDEWYKIKREIDKPYMSDPERDKCIKMNDDEYLKYMIEKRRKEANEDTEI